MFVRVPARAVLVSAWLVVLVSCGRGPEPPAAAPQSDWFVDVARASGLDFTHVNGMSGEFYYPEIMAPGVALLDYDSDGDLDVYVVQGQMLGGTPPAQAPTQPLRDRLFRNDGMTFADVTEASRIRVQSYGMGVAVGDIDNDGRPDIYRTGLQGSVTLRNDGDGTFTDVTTQSGAGDRGAWGVSAAFVDYDRDGWLDLFVGNYLIYDTKADQRCLSVSGRRDYCPPNSYRAQQSRLYHNRGNGRFEDVTAKALVGGAYGPALGVSTADFDGDGWIDIYVANDGQANQLWINQHDGTFKDTGFLSGSAVNGGGNAEASMGVDAGDFDNDGDEDLFIANWQDQMNILYVNDGRGNFEDRKAASGLGPPSLAKTGFGSAWLDFDNDSWLDLFVANGSVATIEAQARAKDPFPLRMTPQLYRNLGTGRFEDVSSRAGRVFQSAEVGRGAAFGDIDNDGDIDILVGNANGPLQLLVNDAGSGSGSSRTPRPRWVGLRLVDSHGRDAVGARVEIVRKTGPVLWRRARADGSYASANDPRVLAGLGASADPPRVKVHWPDGRTEEWPAVAVDRYTTLTEGSSNAK